MENVLVQVKQLIKIGRLDEAKAMLLDSSNSKPLGAESHNLLGVILSEQGDLSGAVSQAKHAVSLEPQNAVFHQNLGGFLHKAKEFEAAVAATYNALSLAPGDSRILLNLATSLRELGRVADEIEIRQRLFSLSPNSENCLALSKSLQRAGRFDRAIELLRSHEPKQPLASDFQFALGHLYDDSGRSDLAIAHYEMALRSQPNFVECTFNLGNSLRKLGRFVEAKHRYLESIQLKPDLTDAWFNLGLTHVETQSFSDAVNCFRRAAEIAPDRVDALINLGKALLRIDKQEDAIEAFRSAFGRKEAMNDPKIEAIRELRAVSASIAEKLSSYTTASISRPAEAALLNDLALAKLESGSPKDSLELLNRALAISPNDSVLLNHQGIVLKSLARYQASIDTLRQSIDAAKATEASRKELFELCGFLIKKAENVRSWLGNEELQKHHAAAWNNLGTSLHASGQHQAALDAYKTSIEIQSDFGDAYANAGNVYLNREPDQAVLCYRKALELCPANLSAKLNLSYSLQKVCDWVELSELVQACYDLVTTTQPGSTQAALFPFAFLCLPITTTPAEQQHCARLWATSRLKPDPGWQHQIQQLHRKPRSDNRIRVGYLSGDFRIHPVSSLIVQVMESHDRQRFEIYGYSTCERDGSLLQQRVYQAFDHVRELALQSYSDIAKAIWEDDIDILVDLSAYTEKGTSEVLAMRPAPIQVNYLGYPGTMGSKYVDYIIADEYVIPRDQRQYFDEEVVYVPGCYQCNDSKREISSRVTAKDEHGLPPDSFVFCSFNNNHKITPFVFDVWMKIMHRVPQSVLWLLGGNQLVTTNLRREAEKRGIDSNRLIFARRASSADHLERHRHVDLFLDTYPYNAHTTASDALFMGVPLITVVGNAFPSRVAGSLLNALGLNDLVVSDWKAYEELAVDLATNSKLLSRLKNRLNDAKQSSDLFQGAAFVKKLESSFEYILSRSNPSHPQSGAR